MDNSTISKRKCYNIYNNVVNDLYQKYNIPYIFDNNYDLGEGYHKHNNNDVDTIIIGTKELESTSFFIHTKIPISLMVKGLITIYHETEHLIQSQEYYNETKIIDTNHIYMLINYLACIGAYNGYYDAYNNSFNYFHCPIEIDAEYEGIIGAHTFLTTEYGESEANKLIIEYINDNIENEYFIHNDKPYTTIDDIDKDFKEAFEQSKIISRKYNKKYITKDESMIYGHFYNPSFLDCFLQLNNSLLQDKVLAGAYLKYLENTKNNNLDNSFHLLSVCKKDILYELENFMDKIKYQKDNNKNTIYER